MASQPHDVPRGFVQELLEYDPLLRIKWDQKDAYWRIERKIRRRWAPTPTQNTSAQDWECMQEGYVIVLRVPPGCLDARVFWTLGGGDIRRRGGARKVAEQMEEAERMESERSHAAFLDEVSQRSKGRWDSWNTNYPKPKGW